MHAIENVRMCLISVFFEPVLRSTPPPIVEILSFHKRYFLLFLFLRRGLDEEYMWLEQNGQPIEVNLGHKLSIVFWGEVWSFFKIVIVKSSSSDDILYLASCCYGGSVR